MNKGKILKDFKDGWKLEVTSKLDLKIKLTGAWSPVILGTRRQQNSAFKVLMENIFGLLILYPDKFSVKCKDRLGTFSDK